MIQSYSRLKVADNSGAKEVMCIRVVGKRNPQFAQLGDLIVGSVKVATPHSNVKKKDIVKAVVVRQRKPYRRPDGTVIRFDDNAIVLLDTEKNPRGSRIFGPVARELRERGYSKIVSMAMEVL